MDLAAENGHFEICEILAAKMESHENNIDEKLQVTQNKNQLIFIYAAEQGDSKTFTPYLEKVDDVDVRDKRRMTAAQLAARKGHFDICEILFKKTQAAPGSTPLDNKESSAGLLDFVNKQLPVLPADKRT